MTHYGVADKLSLVTNELVRLGTFLAQQAVAGPILILEEIRS